MYREGRFEVERVADFYDFTWTLRKDSAAAIALKRKRDVEGKHEMTDNQPRLEAMRHLGREAGRVGIESVLSVYRDQIIIEKLHLYEAHLFEDVEWNIGRSIAEAVQNAVEHGADFCQRGNVKVGLLGGERGALATIEQPGEGFDLKPLSIEECKKRYKQILRDLHEGRKLSSFRGKGILHFTLSRKSVVGSEKTRSGFRVFVHYPIPNESNPKIDNRIMFSKEEYEALFGEPAVL